jgi:beta-N-acetylhexosaminidase
MSRRWALGLWTCTFLVAMAIALVPGGAATPAADDRLQRILASMTLEEKVGQVFVIHVYGRTPTDADPRNLSTGRGARTFQEAIERFHPGGFIYFNFNSNIPEPLDATQVASLSNGLQEIALRQRSPVPLLMATDQEGGAVARVREPGTYFPGAMALGATRSRDRAREAARITARELRALGIHMNYAPVLDVNVNPANPVIGNRSFSETPDLVGSLGTAQVRGLQERDVSATAKHFPGHGDTDTDSHFGLAEIKHDRPTLDRIDLPPFRAAIAAGVDAIMTGHLVVPALDPGDPAAGVPAPPASFSRPILTGLLREELGFDGVIVTDSLDMGGVAVRPTGCPAPTDIRRCIPVAAIKAGADVLLNPPDVQIAYDAMLAAVRSGEISEARLDESVLRILELKERRGVLDDPFVDAAGVAEVVGTESHLRAAARTARRSITLLRNEARTLPLKRGQRVLVTGRSDSGAPRLASQLAASGVDASNYTTALVPTDSDIAEARRRASGVDAVVAATNFTAASAEAQRRFVDALRADGHRVVVAATRNPYDVGSLPIVHGHVIAYGARNISIDALAEVLLGDAELRGRLPVTIPGLYAYGAGIGYEDDGDEDDDD